MLRVKHPRALPQGRYPRALLWVRHPRTMLRTATARPYWLGRMPGCPRTGSLLSPAEGCLPPHSLLVALAGEEGARGAGEERVIRRRGEEEREINRRMSQ